MAEYPLARDRFVDESRVFIGQNDHKAIVLHCTGSPNPAQTADQLGDYFESTPLETSVHYGIDRLGNIDQYVLEKDGAGGNGILEDVHDTFWDQFTGNPNWHTLSIECENDSANSLALTAPQQSALFSLVAYLVKKYSIPISNIKGHFTLEPIQRAECPGPQFPWPPLLAYLQGAIMTMMLPIGWHYDAPTGTLTASNGHTAKLGNAQFILKSPGGWDPKNMPLEEEHGVPGGTQQLYATCLLAWNPKDGVHYAPLGTMYQALQQSITSPQFTSPQFTGVTTACTALVTLGSQLKNDGDTLTVTAQNILAQIQHS
jgi:hypothetical protein